MSVTMVLCFRAGTLEPDGLALRCLTKFLSQISQILWSSSLKCKWDNGTVSLGMLCINMTLSAVLRTVLGIEWILNAKCLINRLLYNLFNTHSTCFWGPKSALFKCPRLQIQQQQIISHKLKPISVWQVFTCILVFLLSAPRGDFQNRKF